MNNPHDLHSWSKGYREEALREARRCHSAANVGRGPGVSGCVLRAWKNALAPLLRSPRTAGQA